MDGGVWGRDGLRKPQCACADALMGVAGVIPPRQIIELVQASADR